MSAAVAPTVSTSLPDTSNSPMDSKHDVLKSEDSRAQSSDKDQKPDVESQNSLAPPPRPTATDTPDYFNSVHNPFSLEPNPFEQSFSGNNSGGQGTGASNETPGKSLLPPVAALTSPALPTTGSNSGYNWSNSLRSGPLSPAMLAGPTPTNDYFDNIGRGFPTPNESSLRTGLTPGGGGSMFPAPSPNSQALFQQLQSGGATPSTIEFHRTALNAAKKNGINAPTSNPTTEPQQETQTTAMDVKDNSQPAVVDPFTHHDAADAANGLFMLAKGGQQNQFQPTNQPSIPPQTMQNDQRDAGPNTRRASQHANGAAVNNGREMSDASDLQSEPTKPATRGKGKKGANTRASTAAGNRRKAEDSPAKGPNKKSKASASMEPLSDESDEDDEKPKGQTDPKKMTDEEKRRNFLERNRVAALKCRQRKKQWLANLQNKVELFTTENDALTATVTQLREEIVNLKTLLLAHKDCPVSQAQGIGPLMMNGMSSGFEPHPYNIPNNMAMQPGAPMPQSIRR
ncbi:bZIP transcription factor atfA [Aspergillus chevalieri]|uniref:Basic leucine zipper (bZIP) transcription factor atfB n=1 Tax=Aspergillus chevalieri TaxID=182096 RepID=A0A7R7VJ35_ASPCH|nr:uncharacterized protein ACHE_21106A [Aspergillus chevalieri]BCR85648.1 hypothetical protein ACHE_21106A [Aspergillus chevalieri]